MTCAYCPAVKKKGREYTNAYESSGNPTAPVNVGYGQEDGENTGKRSSHTTRRARDARLAGGTTPTTREGENNRMRNQTVNDEELHDMKIEIEVQRELHAERRGVPVEEIDLEEWQEKALAYMERPSFLTRDEDQVHA